MSLSDIISIVVGIALTAAVAIYMAANQRNKIKEWLKYAVAETERQLGSGTGRLKLRQVYDWFTDKFPLLAAILPFRVFAAWVDEALTTLERWLESNGMIEDYVYGSRNS